MTKQPDDIVELSLRISFLCDHIIELEKGMLKLHQDFSLLCEPTVNLANTVLELQKMLAALDEDGASEQVKINVKHGLPGDLTRMKLRKSKMQSIGTTRTSSKAKAYDTQNLNGYQNEEATN